MLPSRSTGSLNLLKESHDISISNAAYSMPAINLAGSTVAPSEMAAICAPSMIWLYWIDSGSAAGWIVSTHLLSIVIPHYWKVVVHKRWVHRTSPAFAPLRGFISYGCHCPI